jgi:hypothetical protein
MNYYNRRKMGKWSICGVIEVGDTQYSSVMAVSIIVYI